MNPARPRPVRSWRLLPLAAVAVATLSACDWQGGDANVAFGWERMIDQKKYDAFEGTDLFPDGMAMRRPPEGTISRSAVLLPVDVRTGRTGPGTTARAPRSAVVAIEPPPGDWVGTVPLAFAMSDLRRGRDRFGIYCAVCHGVDGSGVSRVASNMSIRLPPPLVFGKVAAYPAGRIFETITKGYGMMPSYVAQLPVVDRWRVVAYVQALQLAQRAMLDSLSTAERGLLPDSIPATASEGSDR